MYYLIRHGEPDYSKIGTKIYQGVGVDFSSLSKLGVCQIKKAAKDNRLKEAEIIISSPYTRALHSAAILSKELNLEIIIETDLHEWVNDKNYNCIGKNNSDISYQEFCEFNGRYPKGKDCQWENDEILKNRITGVLNKYIEYDKVIVVCHGMLIHSIFQDHWLECGEIVEYNLEK